jgi:hypothetical protein
MNPRLGRPAKLHQLMSSPDGELKICENKVVILGNTGVGKTSIVSKYVTNTFSALTPATIGASFNIKSTVIGKWKVQSQLWDTAGMKLCSQSPVHNILTRVIARNISSPK